MMVPDDLSFFAYEKNWFMIPTSIHIFYNSPPKYAIIFLLNFGDFLT